MARKLKSIKEKKKLNWKGSIAALQYIPRFFNEIRTSGALYFYLNFTGRVLNSLSPIILLWIGKLIIDELVGIVSNNQEADARIWWLIGIELGIAVISDLINRMTTLTDGLLGDLYSNMSSVKIIHKTKELEISQLEDADFYDKLERARQQTNRRVTLMSNAMNQVQSLLVIISLIGGLIYFEPLLIIILIFSIIPAFINEIKFSTERYSIARSWTAERRELDYLRYIGANDKTAKEMKLFGLVDFVADRFKKVSDKYYEVNKKLAVSRSIYGAIFNLLGVLSYYGAYVFIIYRAISGYITIGDVTFLSGSFNRLRSNLQSSFFRFTKISESALYLKDYFDFIDFKTVLPQQENLPLPSSIKEGIQFNNVSFTYPGSDVQVLKNITFHIQAGEKMAFVGENGAGKTTLIKLLLRFYRPVEGEILLDGVNIEKFDKAEYQKYFGVIFQDFIKYEFLVRENIAVGNIEMLENDEAITNAAELSLADQVIAELKDGLNQQLGKRFARGSDLSGGQWQKIALARAYMKDAEFMILDEPTSALDARAEYEAFQRFIGLTKGKTSIIISHRFSTVRMADRIMVLKNGKVSELGSHEELMENNDLYAELFNLQAAGYQ